jgi:hypothetical protein
VPGWEASTGIAATPDAYPTLARSLLDHRCLGYEPERVGPTTARGPAFPAWLAIGMSLGGDDPRWLGFWGGLPGLLLGALLTQVAARRLGTVAALLTGAVAVAHPLPSLIAARVMGDDFYAALGCAALLAWWRATEAAGARRAYGWLAIAALLLSLQMLARSTGLLTLAAAGVTCMRRPGTRLRHVLLLALLALAPPLAWSVRSSVLEGRPVFVHSLFFYNFWVGEGIDRHGAGDPPSGNWNQIVGDVYGKAGWTGNALWYGTLAPTQLAELERRLGAAAFERIREDPAGYLGRCLRGLARFWFQAGTRSRTLQYVALVLPLVVLAAIGAASCRRDPLAMLFLTAIVLHNLAYAAVLPAARMSVQVYPELSYLVGAGAARLLSAPRAVE